MLNTCVELRNGVKMPVLGLGTFKVENGMQTVNSVKSALEIGYRHIDTASLYKNEEGVGQAIKVSGVKREDIFLTTKVWNSDQGYDNTMKAFETSMKKLDTDYLDLYLIHWPKALNKETWRALETLYKENRVRAIGVSNFKEHHIKEIMEVAEVMPMVNQVEFHPQLAQPELLKFCKENHIQLEAWAPLMQGKAFEFETIKELAKKYNKTESQIVLRWHLQTEIVAIPKSINPKRIEENSNIFDFQISKEDMGKIALLNTGVRLGPDPDNITF